MVFSWIFSYGKGSLINVFRYTTFRAMMAFLTAFGFVFFLGPFFIKASRKWQKAGQPIRQEGPASHLILKAGTPTMGGILILISLVLSSLLWANWHKGIVASVLIITLGMGLIGGIDDFLKVSRRNTKGLSAAYKFLAQAGVVLAVFSFLLWKEPGWLTLSFYVPFLKNPLWVWPSLLFLGLAVAVIVGSSNAVNLTDGLDGLAIGPVMIASGVFAVVSYVVGHMTFAHYLQIPYIPGSGELSVLCAALLGSGLGFLWYNTPPAMVFMGDVGSLSLGACLGTIAMLTKHEVLWMVVGGIFVIETLSVILQVFYYKRTKKRIFLMAPLHHHFEKQGWSEATIVMRFWILAILLGILGLSSLKLR